MTHEAVASRDDIKCLASSHRGVVSSVRYNTSDGISEYDSTSIVWASKCEMDNCAKNSRIDVLKSLD